MTEALMRTDLPLPNKRTGKVRDLYDLTLPDGRDGILIVATDRVSAFDVVLALDIDEIQLAFVGFFSSGLGGHGPELYIST